MFPPPPAPASSQPRSSAPAHPSPHSSAPSPSLPSLPVPAPTFASASASVSVPMGLPPCTSFAPAPSSSAAFPSMPPPPFRPFSQLHPQPHPTPPATTTPTPTSTSIPIPASASASASVFPSISTSIPFPTVTPNPISSPVPVPTTTDNPAVDAHVLAQGEDWRATQLPAEDRSKTCAFILSKLKRHVYGNEENDEQGLDADTRSRDLEREAFTIATSRKQYFALVAVMVSTLQESDWRVDVRASERGKIWRFVVSKLQELYAGAPISALQARTKAFEEDAYRHATSRSDYLAKIAEGIKRVEVRVMETRGELRGQVGGG